MPITRFKMVIINAPTIGLVKCEDKWIEERKAHGTINIETPPKQILKTLLP